MMGWDCRMECFSGKFSSIITAKDTQTALIISITGRAERVPL